MTALTDVMDERIFKVLEFLNKNHETAYSKSEIAKASNISLPTLCRIWPLLSLNSLIKETDKIGKSRKYQLNMDSEFIKIYVERLL